MGGVPAAARPAPHAIFGTPDDLKFRSRMTLFGLAAPDEPLFGEALVAFYGGEADATTVGNLDC